MEYRQNADRDELRARFTAWLDTLIRRAKLNYLRKTKLRMEIVSFEELFEDNISVSEDEGIRQLIGGSNDFDLEEERLAKAYAELPLMRQQILKFLYVDELSVGEIAKRLNCSAQYVSDQKQKSLKYFRKKMAEGGDDDG